MDDDEIRQLVSELRDELVAFRRQVNLDVTDLQGAVAELESDFQRRLLRPPRS